jgi:hypothetical protein
VADSRWIAWIPIRSQPVALRDGGKGSRGADELISTATMTVTGPDRLK